MDLSLALAGLLVGLMVGLTGMGGGALLTPILVLVFRVSPLTAISSDLLTSLLMKPVGGAVHLRQRTVDWRLVGWLTAGSVPAGFLGAVAIGSLAHGPGVQGGLKTVIGIALCASLALMLLRQVLDRRTRQRDALAGGPPPEPVRVRPLRTFVIGAVGGFAVGMTSVGAGSLIIAMLLMAYPRLRPAQLVGTDIVQAVPLVAAATLGHLLFGDVGFALTGALLLGALPGVYLGARLSAGGPAALVRPVIAAVLAASALALLEAPSTLVVAVAVATSAAVAVLGRTPHTRSTTPATQESVRAPAMQP